MMVDEWKVFGMGIDLACVQLLCCAKSLGVDFSDTMMVGRQSVNVEADVGANALNLIGIPRSDSQAALQSKFAENLFSLLGANNAQSVDASGYENATYIHDMNWPVPDALRSKFSVVHDGGTIEHVFNVPQAFKNCMDMIKPGGHFIQVGVANNYMGHGFWQFGPELIYRILSHANGFKPRAVLMHEAETTRLSRSSGGSWFKVQDPAHMGSRIELVNKRPTYICTIAQKIEDVEVFSEYPQQSDYVAIWHLEKEAAGAKAARPPFSFKSLIPQPLKMIVRRGRAAMRGSFPAPYYQRISDADLIQGAVGQDGTALIPQPAYTLAPPVA
jgi:hypothetical protein